MPDLADAYRQVAFDLAREPGTLKLHVTGYSMMPLLRPGDGVIAQAVPVESLCRGDLIVIRRPAELITHRLVAVDERGWHAKGDNSSLADAPVACEAILGRVSSIERGRARIDLTRGVWPIVNRGLGRLGAWEARLARSGGARLTRLVTVFFRVLIRLVLFAPLFTARPG